MKAETEHIIELIYRSTTDQLLEDYFLILRELYNIAIDSYTFKREIEWYFYNDVYAMEITRHSDYTRKADLLEAVNWSHVARHFMPIFEAEWYTKHSRILSSYHYKKYIKDPEILDSGRYSITKILGSGTYTIKLKPLSDFKLKR